MNEREKQILDMLRKDPFLTQQEMADRLTVSRPTLANLVSGLIRKGKIAGRAYVLLEDDNIVCIGGANVDRKYHLKSDAQLSTSNPSTLSVSVGGVARNIAENLGRLGHKVHMITAAGKDGDYDTIADSSDAYMTFTHTDQLTEHSTGSYSAVLQPDGEMIMAMANMDVYDALTPEWIQTKSAVMRSASLIVVDLNVPKETIEYIKAFAISESIPLAIVPVSSPKMYNMPSDLSGVTYFICNRDEAESYTGCKIESAEDWKKAVRLLIEAGAQHVVVTAGHKGVMTGSHRTDIEHVPSIDNLSIKDVTGAGDAFVSGVLHGQLVHYEWIHAVKMGVVNACGTLQSNDTVRHGLTASVLKQEMEDYS